MIRSRVIAVIIIRDGQVVQSVQFKHTNVIHYDAFHAIDSFARWNIDEIIILNVSKSRDSQSEFLKIVEKVSETCFVPFSVGGWVDSVEYAQKLVSCGADKLVLNSAFYTNPELVKELVYIFGSQCITCSIDFILTEDGPEVAVEQGSRGIGVDPKIWAETVTELGAGEIMLNCVEHDGNRRGYHLEQLSEVTKTVDVPVIAFGGVFTWKHMHDGLKAGACAVAAANIFHYTEHSTKKAKRYLKSKGVTVREDGL